MTKNLSENKKNILNFNNQKDYNPIVEQELARINDLIMLQKNIKDAAVASFIFNDNISTCDRKHILMQILKKFPVINYATGDTYIKDGCHHNCYARVDLENNDQYSHRYIIPLDQQYF